MAAPVEETAQVKTRGKGLWHPMACEAQWGRCERPGLAGDAGSTQPSVAFSLDRHPTPLFCSASPHPPSCHPRHLLNSFQKLWVWSPELAVHSGEQNSASLSPLLPFIHHQIQFIFTELLLCVKSWRVFFSFFLKL